MSALPSPLPSRLPSLLADVRACRACEGQLPLGPRPVVRASASSTILIVGQAPGTRVHASGIPWDDASGKRLRDWLGVDATTFYDETRFAIVPMGFCYPGRGTSGDNPPLPECARRWHRPLMAELGQIGLTLLIGQYAQRHYLGERWRGSLTETVMGWRDVAPDYLPLPHPSPRNVAWFKRHPWFEREVVPMLRERIAGLLQQTRQTL
ncbi:uracil-DNA glycosylase family protein [Cupriavidus sp. AU9028]|uniref:uracil-DNA glycosylase family protein n=1 Tax=Cupriavidus sp. AU9028 TaxID=2871157 RepID=UPI001C945D09|nr:uracil-DNA glycosylase family protein [Cupriavidus sp. AU9028]MBY4898534.1 uracil-DNA glycosylase family protein [Cupriavidus sp. AU9028]